MTSYIVFLQHFNQGRGEESNPNAFFFQRNSDAYCFEWLGSEFENMDEAIGFLVKERGFSPTMKFTIPFACGNEQQTRALSSYDWNIISEDIKGRWTLFLVFDTEYFPYESPHPVLIEYRKHINKVG